MINYNYCPADLSLRHASGAEAAFSAADEAAAAAEAARDLEEALETLEVQAVKHYGYLVSLKLDTGHRPGDASDFFPEQWAKNMTRAGYTVLQGNHYAAFVRPMRRQTRHQVATDSLAYLLPF